MTDRFPAAGAVRTHLRNSTTIRTRPGVTFSKQNTADTVDTFSEGERQDGDGNDPVRAVIEVDANAARYAYGVDPVSGGLGYPLAEGDQLELSSQDEIEAFRFINDTDAQQVTLVVTMYYDKP